MCRVFVLRFIVFSSLGYSIVALFQAPEVMLPCQLLAWQTVRSFLVVLGVRLVVVYLVASIILSAYSFQK